MTECSDTSLKLENCLYCDNPHDSVLACKAFVVDLLLGEMPSRFNQQKLPESKL